MKRVVIFGYGNPLRGDDGVGWRVAEAVSDCWADRVLVRTAQQPLPEWAADLNDADIACFVDASDIVSAPQLQPVSTGVDIASTDSHNLNPEQLLRLTQTAYGRTPQVFTLHVPAFTYDFGDALSPVARAGVRDAVLLLNAQICHWALLD